MHRTRQHVRPRSVDEGHEVSGDARQRQRCKETAQLKTCRRHAAHVGQQLRMIPRSPGGKKQQGGKRIQVKPEDVTTAGAAEAWMRQVQTTPADFLKLKFAIQANAAPRPPTGSPP